MVPSLRFPTRIALVAALSITAVTAVALAAPAGAAPRGTAEPAPADGSMTDQVIVTYLQSGGRLGAAELAADAGINSRSLRPLGATAEVVKLAQPLGGRDLETVMDRLAKRPGVARVEADQVMHTLTNDSLYGDQWDLTDPAVSGVSGINVEAAWSITTGSTGVRVAVIDTGYVDHADLQGRFIGGYDFVSDSRIGNDGNGRDSNAHDPGDWITTSESQSGFFAGCTAGNSSWHGTHVSGTIGAATNNGQGIAGINQVSQIVPVRVLGKCGGYSSDIVDGMRWAAGLSVSGVPTNPNPARVLSLSLGGGGSCSSTYQNAINQITAAGAVVVVAAGNSNANAANYSPASCNGVVTVAATGKAGNRSYYSNYGNTVEIAAPGGDRIADNNDTILSTLNSGATSPAGDSYERYQGTSMATPHVSGVVALMLSADPALTPAQVTQILQQSARAFPGGSTCAGICGAGLLDAGAAVSAASGGSGTTTTVPVTTTTVPGTTTTVPGTTTTVPGTSTTIPGTTTTTSVPTTGPGAFSKTSPSNGATRQSRRPTLRWASSSGATGYEACLDANVNGACDGSWTTVSGTSARATGLSRRTTYEWQIRAVNPGGSTDADGGTWFTFQTR